MADQPLPSHLKRVARFLRSVRWIKDRDLLTRHNIRALWAQSEPGWLDKQRVGLEDMTEEDWADYNAAFEPLPRAVSVEDFRELGEAFITLYLQAINGVVCDPNEEPGRLGCASCLGAWAKGKAVLDRHDEKWGNMYRAGRSFQP